MVIRYYPSARLRTFVSQDRKADSAEAAFEELNGNVMLNLGVVQGNFFAEPQS